ncbi:DUF421 domain-containing protein [Paenibacillus senegalensis]|uniref:YetF domain-containing protein n=1 Tax=Paenibacillus senegalensis TaxID=1465766 RepID=UPI000288BE16|nr:DUF421 domain-containing protein [Paenibacillus senegalensis]
MEAWSLVFRTVFVYLIVYLVIRIMGKREVGKLSIFDLVISIIIAEIAVFVIEDLNKPLAEGVIPIATLVIIQIGIAYISLKSQRIRQLLEGSPSYIIRHGKLDREEMRKQRYNLDDLMLQLRQSRVTNIADVEFAILETTGKLTVIEKRPDQENGQHIDRQSHDPASSFNIASEQEPEQPTAGDGAAQKQGLAPVQKTAKKDQHKPSLLIPGLHKGRKTADSTEEFASELSELTLAKNKIRYEGLPLPLIMDGKVQDHNLDKLGKTRFWLKNEIHARGAQDFKEVFFCSIDHKGRIYLDKQ